ncbi:hypothetical protein M758_6G162700 [Ceratodon purpureus]|nr:hypothetical protein M758_6G162700 [Ceratodon purpureus]
MRLWSSVQLLWFLGAEVEWLAKSVRRVLAPTTMATSTGNFVNLVYLIQNHTRERFILKLHKSIITLI